MKVPIGWLTFMFELIFSLSHIFYSQPMNLVVKVTAMKKMMTAMMMMMMVMMMMMRYYPCMVHSCLTLIKVKIVH